VKKILPLLIICLSILLCNISFAQKTRLDSLLLKYNKEKSDTSKANLSYLIGEQYKLFNPDSAIYFYNKSLALSKAFISNPEIKLKFAQTLSSIGWVYCLYKSQCDTALVLIQKSLNIFSGLSKLSDKNITIISKKGIASCYSRFGVVYSNKGIYDKAIDNFLKSLRISEEFNDKKFIAVCYNNIGIAYYYQSLYDKSIEYYQKSLKIREELNDVSGIMSCYNNLGLIYSEKEYYKNFKLEKSDSLLNLAIQYYQKYINYSKQFNDKQGLALCYGNMANVLTDQIFYSKINLNEQNGLINSAFKYYKKSLNIYKEIGDKNGMATVLANISEFHSNIADILVTSKNKKTLHYAEAIKYGLKAINIANEINALLTIQQTSLYLKDAYQAIGNAQQALKYANIYIITNDSMFKEEQTQAFAEMEAKYKAEKKQLEIDKLQKQKALDKETIARKNAETKKQKMVIYTFIFGFIIIIMFVVIISRLFLQKKKANIILSKQYVEIQQKNEEIISQRDEIEAQRDKLSLQNNILTEQKKDITDSINYAKRIQQALLPNFKEILSSKYKDTNSKSQAPLEFGTLNLEPESFVLFKPKDIVSGDFYWATQTTTRGHAQLTTRGHAPLLIIAVADCTGHGVPGAFMSMLGISFLNEIVRKKEIVQASQILDQLRVSIIDALKQTGQTGEQKDGMDISLVVINTTSLDCQFAGANNPIYIVRVSKNITKEKNLTGFETRGHAPLLLGLEELKGDNMPVSIYERMNNFTNHEFKINKGDSLYLFSDGYADQFGGKNERKFMYREFKKIILENAHLLMEKQNELLNTTIENWKGNNKQTDDITVLGLRI